MRLFLRPSMPCSKRYIGISILAAAVMVLYLANSAGYRSLAPQSRLPVHVADRPPYTAAVVYLVSVMPGPRNPDELLRSLPLMQKNIPWRHQWPVLLIHAGAYATAESQLDFLRRLRDSARGQDLTPDATEKLVNRIEFVTTYHELPEGIPATGGADHPIWDGEWPGAGFSF